MWSWPYSRQGPVKQRHDEGGQEGARDGEREGQEETCSATEELFQEALDFMEGSCTRRLSVLRQASR